MKFDMRIKLAIIIAITLFGCKSNSFHLDINYSPNTEQYDLNVRDYLNEDGLFTLSLLNKNENEIGKTAVYLLYKNQEGKTYTHHLYTIGYDDPQKYESSKSSLIDDNSISLNSKGKYVIYNQGKGFGYSDDERVEFLPSKIDKGIYDLQVVLFIENSKEYVYSNVIKLDIPFNFKDN